VGQKAGQPSLYAAMVKTQFNFNLFYPASGYFQFENYWLVQGGMPGANWQKVGHLLQSPVGNQGLTDSPIRDLIAVQAVIVTV
jgi:hypothetical protein